MQFGLMSIYERSALPHTCRVNNLSLKPNLHWWSEHHLIQRSMDPPRRYSAMALLTPEGLQKTSLGSVVKGEPWEPEAFCCGLHSLITHFGYPQGMLGISLTVCTTSTKKCSHSLLNLHTANT